MKALTLKHPWAYAIRELGKDVENRTWLPPRETIGDRIAIHAGKLPPARSSQWRPIIETLRRLHAQGLAPASEKALGDVATQGSGVVAVATLAGVYDSVLGGIRMAPSFDRMRWIASPWAIEGNIHWMLADVVALEPVPCRGAQGLWALSPDVDAAVREQLAARGAA